MPSDPHQLDVSGESRNAAGSQGAPVFAHGPADQAPAAKFPVERMHADLPDNVACLAEQLTADAARLASVYPAREIPASLLAVLAAARAGAAQTGGAHSAGRLRRLAPWARQAAAALLLAAAGWGLHLWRGGQAGSAPNMTDSLPVNLTVQDQGEPRSPESLVHPAGWFDRFDNSEREGVLDLLEEGDATDVASVSL